MDCTLHSLSVFQKPPTCSDHLLQSWMSAFKGLTQCKRALGHTYVYSSAMVTPTAKAKLVKNGKANSSNFYRGQERRGVFSEPSHVCQILQLWPNPQHIQTHPQISFFTHMYIKSLNGELGCILIRYVSIS